MTGPGFRFASFPIANQIFYQTKLSLGIVNLKPLVPGHVLVISKRVVSRFKELTKDEVSDLFRSVQHVSMVIEEHYSAGSMTVAIQDGKLAGQSVPHIHVHVIPRSSGDFEPKDKIYDALESIDLSEGKSDRTSRRGVIVEDDARIARGADEMKQEAMELSQLFPLEMRGTFD